MARSIWSGAISFGLVNVPIKLHPAISRKTVRFHQLNADTGVRIQQKRVDPSTGDEVAYEQLVKGFELTKDRYVVITPDELAALDPAKTKTIDIEDFVALDEIDPLYFDAAYYAVPDAGAAKSYRLLIEAMEETGRVAIARFVLRNREQLVALRPRGDLLVLETLVFHDEVVDPDQLEGTGAATEGSATEREVAMARALIDSLAADWEPERYRDEYREQVLELIERKAQGEEIAVQPEAEEPERAPDLMAALEASLAAVKEGDGGDGDGRKGGGGKKRAPAKKSDGRKKASPAKS